MRIITAIDFLGIPVTPLDTWSHQLVCPWCQEDAWAVSDYLQCYNPTCTTQAATAEDLLAHQFGGYAQAAQIMAQEYKHEPDLQRAKSREAERLVLDTWLRFCVTPPTNEALQAAGRLQASGYGIRSSRFGAIVLDSNQIKQLVDVAVSTGAEVPEAWQKTPPSVVRAFCVQTRPHTVDRIIVMHHSGRTEEIVWYSHAAGFCSLLGLRPNRPRLLAADIETALKLQHDLTAVGKSEEVACIHLDLHHGDPCPRWEVQEHLLTAVPRHCATSSNAKFFGPNDIVRIQNAMDHFPGAEGSVRGLPIDHVINLRPREQAVAWSSLRFAMIASMVPSTVAQMPPAAASIFEQTGTKAEDAAALIDCYTKQGRQRLVEDVEMLAMTRVILRDRSMTVKETANDYRIIRGADTALLTNFSLRITSNVTFRNHKADRYCQATMRCGKAVVDVIFPQTLLNDRVQSLEGELQRQITVADMVTQAGRMPTVIEINKFRQFVVPHLRTQAAKAKPIRGVDMLGWSDNRKSFMFPGFVVTASGTEAASQILCPSVPVLSRYKAIPLAGWSESCPANLDSACHDIIAMMVASSVRYFRRCITQPIMIAQNSAAMTLLDRLSIAMGQHEIHTLNSNAREGSRIEGIYGYPLLAAGARNAGLADSQTPFLHLTDSGYSMSTPTEPQQAAAAGRAAQFCLKKVVEWCLETGGDAFQEVPALIHYHSLLREGRWLIEHVCGIKNWTISHCEATALEKLLAQIPYAEAGRRITLIDGQDLSIDIRGLDRDHDGILREARDMGTIIAINEDQLASSAVRLLPAIATYYGQEPDVTVVVS